MGSVLVGLFFLDFLGSFCWHVTRSWQSGDSCWPRHPSLSLSTQGSRHSANSLISSTLIPILLFFPFSYFPISLFFHFTIFSHFTIFLFCDFSHFPIQIFIYLHKDPDGLPILSSASTQIRWFTFSSTCSPCAIYSIAFYGCCNHFTNRSGLWRNISTFVLFQIMIWICTLTLFQRMIWIAIYQHWERIWTMAVTRIIVLFLVYHLGKTNIIIIITISARQLLSLSNYHLGKTTMYCQSIYCHHEIIIIFHLKTTSVVLSSS